MPHRCSLSSVRASVTNLEPYLNLALDIWLVVATNDGTQDWKIWPELCCILMSERKTLHLLALDLNFCLQPKFEVFLSLIRIHNGLYFPILCAIVSRNYQSNIERKALRFKMDPNHAFFVRPSS